MAARAKSKGQRDREAHQQEVFEALEGVLGAAGFQVTVSKSLDGRGGDCVLRGERRVIVSRRLPLSERIEVLADVASRLDLSAIDVPPIVRGLLGLEDAAAAPPPPPRKKAARA